MQTGTGMETASVWVAKTTGTTSEMALFADKTDAATWVSRRLNVSEDTELEWEMDDSSRTVRYICQVGAETGVIRGERIHGVAGLVYVDR